MPKDQIRLHFSILKITTIAKALKYYRSVHSGSIRKEVRLLEARLNLTQYEKNSLEKIVVLNISSEECHTLHGALQSYTGSLTGEEELQAEKIDESIYEQWHAQGKLPPTWPSPVQYKLRNQLNRKYGRIIIGHNHS